LALIQLRVVVDQSWRDLVERRQPAWTWVTESMRHRSCETRANLNG